MDNNTVKEIERLFNDFKREENISSFAMQNLLNRTLSIIQNSQNSLKSRKNKSRKSKA